MDASKAGSKLELKVIPDWFSAVLIVFVCVIFVILGLSKLSSTEVVLLGVIQTIFSLAAGWLITHAYAKKSEFSAVRDVEEAHQKNLRIFALKAAEKVENLSRELGRLAIYLSQELEEDEYESSDAELLAKEERIESAIHLLNTLKSVNDTSLSDWRGVIGDEIDEIRFRADQREETLEKLVDKIQSIQEDEEVKEVNAEASKTLVREINKLRRDLNFVAGGVVGNLWTARRSVPSSGRQAFHGDCPNCGNAVVVKQKGRLGNRKGVICTECSSRLVAEVVGSDSIDLYLRRELQEEFACQACGQPQKIMLDELPGASGSRTCSNCSTINMLTRSVTGLVVRGSSSKGQFLTEEILNRVAKALPEQPWPKGIHGVVAHSLNLDVSLVRKAISQLILSGVCKDQFQGVLCTPGEKLILMRSLGKEME